MHPAWGPSERLLHGGAAQTTNNRMEMTASIEGPRALTRHGRVTVFTSLSFMTDGARMVGGRWPVRQSQTKISGKNWRNSLISDVTWLHVRSHSGHPDHERRDQLAREAARRAA